MRIFPMKSLVIICINLVIGLSCSALKDSKTEIIKTGRLEFRQILYFGNTGTHGSKGWYVVKRELFINGKKFEPENINVDKDIPFCEASPNEAVEVLKCEGFSDLKENVYLLRIDDEKPLLEMIYSEDYVETRGENSGEWLNNGQHLIFKDFLIDVRNSEKIYINGLPDYPYSYFRTASPDLKTIVYQGVCFNSNIAVNEDIEKRRTKTCSNSQNYSKNKQTLLWLINAETGETEFLTLSQEKYDWLNWNKDKFSSKKDWLNFFQQQLIWTKDKNNNFKLVSPK